jgi:hypothetical protein
LRRDSFFAEHHDEGEDAREQQSIDAKRESNQRIGQRRPDIRAHDDADGGTQGEYAGIDQPDDHDGHRGAGLDHARDQGTGEQAGDGGAGNLCQHRAHAVDRQRLDAVAHEFEAEHENAQASDDWNDDVLEDVGFHRVNSPCRNFVLISC